MSVAASVAAAQTAGVDAPRPATTYIPYSDAAPVLSSLRGDLLPAELRGKTRLSSRPRGPTGLRDAMRQFARESTRETPIPSFTSCSSAHRSQSSRESASGTLPGLSCGRQERRPVALCRRPILIGSHRGFHGRRCVTRHERADAVRAAMSSSVAESTRRARAGRSELRRYLQERVERRRSGRTSDTTHGPAGRRRRSDDAVPRSRSRADTSILVDFGIEETLVALKTAGLLQQGAVRRVAIIGPGLDFTGQAGGIRLLSGADDPAIRDGRFVDSPRAWQSARAARRSLST